MEHNSIIESSMSEWASPIVFVPKKFVPKKDGSLRMCINLNSVSEADVYPMLRINNLINRLGEARYISTPDLTRGYW